MKKKKLKLIFILQAITFMCYSKTYFTVGDSSKNYISFISLNGHLATNSKAIGVKYVGNFILKNNNKIGLGFNLASEKIWLSDNIIIPQNISTNIFFGTGGVNIRYQINKYFVFQPEFSILYGKQVITELKSTPASFNPMGYPTSYKYSENKMEQTILGTHLEQYVFYYPKKAQNLILGLSIFERIINAKYYDEDFGINGYIGLYF